MDVRVAGLVWMQKADLGPEAIAMLKKKLTIVPRKTAAYDDAKPVPVPCWSETAAEFGVPRRYFFDTAAQQHNVTWDMSEGSPIKVTSLIRQVGRYAEQAEATDAIVEHFQKFDGTQDTGANLGALIKAVTGFGKTQTGLAVAHRIGRTTLIITHKERLFMQWQARIAKVFPDAKVGVCRGKKCKFEGMDFVVAMMKSLSLEEEGGGVRYPEEFYRWPGLILLDEVHRVGAPTWASIPDLFSAKYRLGVTATPRRRDGADKVFWWHIGPIVYSARTETPKPDVRIIKANYRGPDIIHKADAPPALVFKIMGGMTLRNRLIVWEVFKAVTSPAQRKVMVLSVSIDHLRRLDIMFKELLASKKVDGITTDFYVGAYYGDGTKKEEDEPEGEQTAAPEPAPEVEAPKKGKKKDDPGKRKIRTEAELHQAERARVIWATYSMVAEGVDIPALDTVGFATPMADVEQPFGRHRRYCTPVANGGEMTPEQCEHYCSWRAATCQNKPNPITFDINDVLVPLAVRRHGYRMEFYSSLGVKIAQ